MDVLMESGEVPCDVSEHYKLNVLIQRMYLLVFVTLLHELKKHKPHLTPIDIHVVWFNVPLDTLYVISETILQVR